VGSDIWRKRVACCYPHGRQSALFPPVISLQHFYPAYMQNTILLNKLKNELNKTINISRNANLSHVKVQLLSTIVVRACHLRF
jgi:hypothetical protein